MSPPSSTRRPLVGRFTIVALSIIVVAAMLVSALVILVRALQNCDGDCKSHGHCTSDWPWNDCIAASDTECQASELCRYDGYCSAVREQCVPAKEVDCRRATVCRDYGRCTPRASECVAKSTADCRKSTACKTEGRCSSDSFVGACEVSSDEDCRRSTACTVQERCTADAGRCVAAPPKP